ncbi:MAG: hypothetical protein KDK64_06145, partial [Chlamydiia bacterium]|nr:hypothetical protein [Chlamydiia bacterium]
MGKYSSSSAQSKPLFFLSLAASLALHAGGIFLLLRHPPSFLVAKEIPRFEQAIQEDENISPSLQETFQNLIIRDEEGERALRPKLESERIPFIIKEHDISFTCHEKETPQLDIAPYAPPLIGSSWITSKNSPFLDKKSINFNRGISTESTEELAPSPFIAAETPPSEPRNPYIENHWEKQ